MWKDIVSLVGTQGASSRLGKYRSNLKWNRGVRKVVNSETQFFSTFTRISYIPEDFSSFV